jgi:hypothetical protein
LQSKNVKALVLDILHEPEKHVEHARRLVQQLSHYAIKLETGGRYRFAASLIMSMTYGKNSPTYYSDPEVQEINRNGSRLGTLTQIGVRSHIIDLYPFLRYVPWITKTLRKWHEDELNLFSRQVNIVRKQVVCLFNLNILNIHYPTHCFRLWILQNRHLLHIF